MEVNADRMNTKNKADIDIVLFDFGGVIAEEGFMKGLRVLAAKSRYTSDEFIQFGNDLIHRCGYVVGKSSEHTYWDLLRNDTGVKGTDEELRNEILSRFIPRLWVLDIVDGLMHIPVKPATCSGNNFTTIPTSNSPEVLSTKVAGLRQFFA